MTTQTEALTLADEISNNLSWVTNFKAAAELRRLVSFNQQLMDEVARLQKREWVGLTHEEVNSWELPVSPTVFEFSKFIEAKLKEKNHA